jgi:hypothetical protein
MVVKDALDIADHGTKRGFSGRRHTRLVLATALIAVAAVAVAYALYTASTSVALRLDCDFPGGNIKVDRIRWGTVYLQQDLRDSTDWWFYWNFRVRDAASRRMTFHFTNGNVVGSRGPAFSLDGGRHWSWLGQSARGNAFGFSFPEDAEEVYFGVAIPYQESHLKAFLLRHAQDPNLAVKELCKTEKGRSVERLHAGRLDGSPDARVLLTARHHASEMTASYCLEGMLESVLGDTVEGRWFRDHVEVLAVPLVDKDGVEDGDPGKYRAPHDHNRDYAATSIYPSVRAIRRLVPAWSRGRLRVALDLHSPGIRGKENEVIRLVGVPDQAVWRESEQFGRVLEESQRGSLRYHAANNVPFGQDWNNSKHLQGGKTAAMWAGELEGVWLAVTVEIPYASVDTQEVNAKSARQCGADLARALREYLVNGERREDHTRNGQSRPTEARILGKAECAGLQKAKSARSF